MQNPSSAAFGQPVVCPVLIGRGVHRDSPRRQVDQLAAGGRMVLPAGACFPQDRAAPYAPLLDLLRAALTGRSPEAVAAGVAPFEAELHPLLPDLVSRPADAPTADQEPDRRRIFAALAHCLASRREIATWAADNGLA